MIPHETSADAMLAALEAQREDHLAVGPASLALRRDRLQRCIDLLRTHEDTLVDAICRDFGHRSEAQSRFTDIAASITALDHAQKHVGRWMRSQRRKVGPFPLNLLGAKARIDYQPLGVVGVISPWNFPVSLTFTPLAGVLAAGNRALIKPSEYTPATSEALASAVAQHFDPKELHVVTGGPQTGADFSALPFDHLIFTGATSVARHVMRAAAEHLVPVTLELGGKSPVIVGRTAAMQAAAERIVLGKMLNAGQICLAPDYALVPRPRIDEFIEAIRAAVCAMYPTLLENDDYASMVNKRHFDRIRGYLDEARAQDAQVIELNPASEDFSKQPNHKLPLTLIVDPDDKLAAMQDEIFGPVLPVKPYESIKEAIDFVNARPRPLGLYYFGDDDKERSAVLAQTISGGVTINDVVMHAAQEDLPFGGIGPSGMGCYHGIDGFRTFSHAKSVFTQSKVNVADLAGLQPPYGEKLRRTVRQQIGK
ncbi:MAG: coniferyl aldehyde dehydrogenase [Pseudomonadota bacterium]